jgi:GNAT superfamily N-acetyltransferase
MWTPQVHFPGLCHRSLLIYVAVTTAIQSQPQVVLREILSSPPERDMEELRAMRIACGWHVEEIPNWLRQVETGTRLLFFVYPGSSAEGKPAGMISLDLLSEKDLSMADFRNTGRVEISSLFVYKEYRRTGMGAAAFTKLEDKAREMGAKVAVVNTMLKGPNLQRYEKIGYKQYKEPKKVYVVGDLLRLGLTEDHAYAAYLEKPLTPQLMYR